MQKIYGFDLGGVIISQWTKEQALRAARGNMTFNELKSIPQVQGMINMLKLLAKESGSHNIFIISRANDLIEKGSKMWLESHQILKETHIPEKNVIFCKIAAAKGPICEERKITHFVDDSPDVLDHIRRHYIHKNKKIKLFLFNQTKEQKSENGYEEVSESNELLNQLMK